MNRFHGACSKHSVAVLFLLLAALTLPPVLQAQAGYGGPAISSRGTRQAGQRGSEPVTIRPYATVQGIVDSGMFAVVADSQGRLSNIGTLYGVEANIGAYGSREWRRSKLGLEYQGNYRHYTNNQFFNGSDQLLSLDYSRQAGRRTTFQLRGTGGTSSRSVGGLFAYGAQDPSYFGIPANDLFDNRAYFAEAAGSMVRQIGAKNSFSAGGSAFGVRRQSKFLVGVNGYRAFGDFSRQLGRRSAIGVSYSFIHVDYPRVFGEADLHVVQLQYTRQFGRFWRMDLAGGIFRSDFTGTRQVTLDPLVAELLGQVSGREAFNAINYQPALGINFTYTKRRSTLTFGYNRSANPGNGVLLLNRQENVSAIYSYRFDDRWSLSGSAGFNNATGIGQYSGSFRNYQAGSFVSYMLRDDLHFTAGYDLRRFSSNSTGFNRIGSRVTMGIAYSPGEMPLSIR